MVRIVNGVIVDDPPKNSIPQQRSEPVNNNNRQNHHKKIFPDTGGYFGSMSESIEILKYEFEYFWILVLFVTGFLFGGKSLAILVFCLILLQRNMQVLEKKDVRFNTLNNR